MLAKPENEKRQRLCSRCEDQGRVLGETGIRKMRRA
jgi:hypothetical protein